MTLSFLSLPLRQSGQGWWSDRFQTAHCVKDTSWHEAERQEHCIIFPITEEHSELLNHAEVHKIGLTSRRAFPESFKWVYQQGNCSFPACLADTSQIKIFQWTWHDENWNFMYKRYLCDVQAWSFLAVDQQVGSAAIHFIQYAAICSNIPFRL